MAKIIFNHSHIIFLQPLQKLVIVIDQLVYLSCYESNLPHINMEETTAKRLVEYMIENKESNTLRLHWFGGEPLVGISRIDQICEELTKSEIKFHSTMTSNGYLFTEPIVKRAVDAWKLDSVQITLDGTIFVDNKFHKRKRPWALFRIKKRKNFSKQRGDPIFYILLVLIT